MIADYGEGWVKIVFEVDQVFDPMVRGKSLTCRTQGKIYKGL